MGQRESVQSTLSDVVKSQDDKIFDKQDSIANLEECLAVKPEIEFLKLSPNTAQPNLDRDLANDPRYKVFGIPHLKAFDRAIGLGSGLVGMMVLGNIMTHRPNLPLVPLYIVVGVGGYYVGKYADNVQKTRRLRDDLVIWDYVRRHPEDFPEVFERRKTFGEVILSWDPRR